jgi:hypothetical protein
MVEAEADAAPPTLDGKRARAAPQAPRPAPRPEARLIQCYLHLADLAAAHPNDPAAPAARALLIPYLIRGKELRIAMEARRAAELRRGAEQHHAIRRDLAAARRRIVALIAPRGVERPALAAPQHRHGAKRRK